MDTITIERLREREHQLHAYCHVCDRWRVLDLDAMLQQWATLVAAPTEVQCPECGAFGILKVRSQVAQPADQPAPVAANG
jgi:hypothetical protein